MDENSKKGDSLKKDETIQLSMIPKKPGIVREELEKGRIVAMRAKNDFIYIALENEKYHMFTHTVGEREAGRRDCAKDEHSDQMIYGMVQASDAMYAAEYKEGMAVFSVLAAMEDAITSRFPTADSEPVEDNKE